MSPTVVCRGVADGEPVATEWHEPIVDTSAEEIAAAMIASTDCLAHLRGDCVTEVSIGYYDSV